MDLIQTVVVSLVALQGLMTSPLPNTNVVIPQIRRGSQPAVSQLCKVQTKDCFNAE